MIYAFLLVLFLALVGVAIAFRKQIESVPAVARVANWLRQNAVTLIEIAELSYEGISLLILAFARAIALTSTTGTGTWVAKLHDALKAGAPPFKAWKQRLLHQ